MKKSFSILFASVLFVSQCLTAQSPSVNEQVLVPQTGYQASMQKLAVVRVQADSFRIVNDKGIVQMSGKLSAAKKWPFSDETVQQADFTSLKTPGKYQFVVPGTDVKRAFEINPNPFDGISHAAVKALYYNRCSYPISEEFGGKWARKAGHPDTKVLVHKSAVSDGRPEGFVLSSPGGWYDAGDYNKYIVNSSISVFTMMLAYDLFPGYWDKTVLNIPESKNKVPDMLDEMLFNLRWMMTMQDKDGGVYHKLTTLAFEPFVMPSEAHADRYVVMKSTAAGLDFAAVMAHASTLFSKFSNELPGLSDSCKRAAEAAWAWCLKNPNVIYNQPADVSTGTYGDDRIKDEWFWAGTEMCMLSGKAYPDSLLKTLKFSTPSWDNVATLGILSTVTGKSAPEKEKAECKKILLDMTDHFVNVSQTAAYPVSIDRFAWGSNSDVVNQGMLKIVAYTLTGDMKYVDSAVGDMEYITGMNPTGYCYITGIGEKSPMNIHHRPSGSDGIVEPVPGFLAGGPNLVVMTDCPNAVRSKFPASSYVDELCSYSTNEIAINWNTPLAFLAGSLSNYAMEKQKYK
jgi:endoglucanase